MLDQFFKIKTVIKKRFAVEKWTKRSRNNDCVILRIMNQSTCKIWIIFRCPNI